MFTKSDDGNTVVVTVPCGCLSITEREGRDSASTSPSPECAGEMTVSVSEEQVPEAFVGIAKALRMTVMVVH